MTSLSRLKAQADRIAKIIKAAERGEKIDVQFAEKIAEARLKPSFKVAVVMDHKTIIVEMPWQTIQATGEVGLAEFILNQMRDQRETLQ